MVLQNYDLLHYLLIYKSLYTAHDKFPYLKVFTFECVSIVPQKFTFINIKVPWKNKVSIKENT